jgi:hypothetical protein
MCKYFITSLVSKYLIISSSKGLSDFINVDGGTIQFQSWKRW